MGEHPRLARTGAGHDEQRALGVGDRLVLDRVEAGDQIVAGEVARIVG
jgi:hypothetical protein